MIQWLKQIWNKRSVMSSEQYPWMLTPKTSAGISVNEDTALNLSAVYCAVRTIAGELASLECKLYQDVGENREEAFNHPIYNLLVFDPNPEMTPFVFFETMTSYLLRYGNCYAEIERDGAGQAKALWPLHPSVVSVERDPDGNLIYKVLTQQTVWIKPEDMIHVPGLGNGTVGISPIRAAAESMGLSLATERYGSAFFGNSVRPSGIIKAAGRLSDQARANIKQSIEASHSGPANSARLMVLEEGLEFNPFSWNLEDYQFLETRRFQIEEISRWFCISPTWLKELGRATWNNLAQENLAFYQTTLRHWCIKFEQEIERKLLTPNERHTYFIEFFFDSVLRADPETRYKIYDIGTRTGVLEVNECRAFENRNPRTLPAPMPKQITQEKNGNQSDQANPDQPAAE